MGVNIRSGLLSKVLLLGACLAWSLAVWANESAGLAESRLQLTAPSHTKMSVELEHSTYYNFTSPAYEGLNSSANSSEVIVGLLHDNTAKAVQSYMHLQGYLSPDSQNHDLNARELYFASEKFLDEDMQFTLGRRVYDWSLVDTFWQTGLWQPRFERNRLHPINQGLMGAFLDRRSGNLRVLGFITALSIPDQSPKFVVDGGRFQSENPWFHAPISSIPIGNQSAPIRYDVETPDIQKIAAKPGGAFKIEYDVKDDVVLSGAYAYKPMSQIFLGFVDRFVPQDNIEAEVQIHPRILYHRLLQAEATYAPKPFWISLGFMNEDPIRDQTPINWTTQEVSSAQWMSLLLGWQWGESRSESFLTLGYLRREGGDAPDQGPLASSNSYFDSRFKLSNSYALKYDTPIQPLFQGRLRNSTRLTYDVDQRGTIVSSEFRFAFSQQLSISVGADVLGIVDEGDAQDPNGFIRKYRANDRYQGSMSYVF